jgi:hypothetical protein
MLVSPNLRLNPLERVRQVIQDGLEPANRVLNRKKKNTLHSVVYE